MVTFYEILPNPAGKDSQNEWIKLYNSSDQAINISGWKIKDASGKTFVFSQKEIDSKSFLTVFSGQTKISLNNDGDKLFLYDQNNNLADEASYNFNVSEGAVLPRKDNLFISGQNTILKENQLSSKQIDKVQQTVPASQRLAGQANVLNNKPSAQNLIIGVTIAFVLSLVFIIIIKKLLSINED
ncbi:MAG: lamin tail domain-containing protein [Candidatus Paceibacterota bacterium]|jgi:hypothetical protein